MRSSSGVNGSVGEKISLIAAEYVGDVPTRSPTVCGDTTDTPAISADGPTGMSGGGLGGCAWWLVGSPALRSTPCAPTGSVDRCSPGTELIIVGSIICSISLHSCAESGPTDDPAGERTPSAAVDHAVGGGLSRPSAVTDVDVDACGAGARCACAASAEGTSGGSGLLVFALLGVVGGTANGTDGVGMKRAVLAGSATPVCGAGESGESFHSDCAWEISSASATRSRAREFERERPRMLLLALEALEDPARPTSAGLAYGCGGRGSGAMAIGGIGRCGGGFEWGSGWPAFRAIASRCGGGVADTPACCCCCCCFAAG